MGEDALRLAMEVGVVFCPRQCVQCRLAGCIIIIASVAGVVARGPPVFGARDLGREVEPTRRVKSIQPGEERQVELASEHQTVGAVGEEFFGGEILHRQPNAAGRQILGQDVRRPLVRRVVAGREQGDGEERAVRDTCHIMRLPDTIPVLVLPAHLL